MCARDRLRADGPFAPPASLLLLVFVGLIVVPTTLYLYAAHPAWTWMYMVDPESIPGFAIVPLVVAHSGAILAGWYLGARLIIAQKFKLASYIAGGGVALVLLGTALFWGRLSNYGSYAEYRQGRAIDLMDVKLGYVLVALLLGLVTAASFLAIELVRDSRRVRSR